nr:hypothetical protein [Tanacetum cinerariifolium]
TIPLNSAFQTEDLDTYDSDCDDIFSTKAVLMENLSRCNSDVLSEESQNAGIQDTNSSAANDLLVLSLVEQTTTHVANLEKENQTNKMVNESLIAELERYKERVAIFEQRQNTNTNTAVSKPSATIAPGMIKLDREPITYRLKNNRDVDEVYLEKTIENTNTLCGLVKCARRQNPSEPLLESASMFTKHIQEVLVYVSKTCPSLTKPIEKLVAVTPMNKDKNVSFVEPVTSSSNITKQTDSLRTKDFNKPLLTSTKVNATISSSGSKPSGNIKKK